MYKKFDDLVLSVNSHKELTYDSLLNCIEWQDKRKEILQRDGFKCQDCGVINSSNHVHHTFYLRYETPWNVPDTCLVTLCNTCHDNRHSKETIPWYQYVNGKVAFVDKNCPRCGGRGHISEFKHVQGGTCFKCGGQGYNINGVIEIILKRKEELAKK